MPEISYHGCRHNDFRDIRCYKCGTALCHQCARPTLVPHTAVCRNGCPTSVDQIDLDSIELFKRVNGPGPISHIISFINQVRREFNLGTLHDD